MPRLNRRVVVVTLAVLALVGGTAGALFLLARGSHLQKRALLHTAENYFKNGNHSGVVVTCLRGIRIDRGEPRFYELVAESSVALGQTGNAIRAYERLAGLRPDSVKELEAVCKLCETHGHTKLLADTAEKILKRSKDHLDAHVWRANAFAARRDLDRAIEHMKAALKLDRQRLDTYTALATLHEAKNDKKQADHTYQKALEVHADAPALRIAYGQFLHRTGRADEAEASLRKAVGLAPKQAGPELALARFYLATARREQAGTRFRAALKKEPDGPRAILDYGKFLFTGKQFQEAIEEFEKAIGDKAAQWEAREWVAESCLALGKEDAARKQLDQIPKEVRARRARSLSITGRLRADDGRTWDAIRFLERSVRLQPGFAEAHMFLGIAYRAVREHGTSLACFRNACRLAPSRQRYQLELARTELILGHHGPAIQRSRFILTRHPMEATIEADARLLLAQCYAALGDTENTAGAVRAASKAVGDETAQQIRLAALYISQRKLVAAQQLLEQFVATHKDSLPAVSALAQTYMIQGKRDDAERILLGAMQASPKALAPTLHYARLCLSRGDKDNAKLALQRLLDSNPDELGYQRAMASFCIATGAMDEALQRYRAAASKDPENVDVKATLFLLLLRRGKLDEATACAAEIKAREPQSLRTLLITPRLLVARGKSKEAIEALNAVVARKPHEWLPHQLLGATHAHAGNIPKAIRHLKAAAAIHPNSIAIHLMLADAYYKNKLYGLAIAEAQRVLQTTPSSRSAHMIAAYSHTAERATDDAIQEWNTTLELGEGRTDHYVMLGKLYLDKNDLDKAEHALREAHRRAPESPVAIQALAHLHRIKGRPSKAEALLRQFVQAHPTNPIGHLILGEHLRVTEKWQEAETQLRKAIATSPKSPGCYVVLGNFQFITGNTDDAIASYRQAMELSTDPASARLLLVRALVAARRLDEADALVAKALAEHPDDVRALVQKAQIMLPRAYHLGDHDAVQEAIDLCQRALNADPNYADGHYVVAKAYLSQTPPQLLAAESELRRALQIAPHAIHMRVDRAKLLFLLERYRDAQDESRKVLRTQPNNFAALVVLADATLAAGDNKQPLQLAHSLMRQYPKNPAAQFLIGRVHHRAKKLAEAAIHYKRAFTNEKHAVLALDGLIACSLDLGKPDQAIAFCNEFIRNNPRSVQAHQLLGTIYLNAKRFDDAERALRQSARLNPVSIEPVLSLLRLYRKQERGDLALAACQSYVKRWPRNPTGHIVLGRAHLEQRKLDDAEKCFCEALRLSPRSVRALSLVTNCCIERNDAAAAIAQCTRFIKHNPGSAVAYSLLGSIYERQKDKAKADECLRKASALAPRFVVPHLLLADLNMTHGNYDLAVKNYEDVLEIDPSNPVALNNAAYLLADRDTGLDKADAMAKKLLSRLPHDANALDTAGWVSFKRGDTDAAIDAFHRGLEVRKDDPSILYHLAAALLRRGDRQGARAALEKALATGRGFPAAAKARELLSTIPSK